MNEINGGKECLDCTIVAEVARVSTSKQVVKEINCTVRLGKLATSIIEHMGTCSLVPMDLIIRHIEQFLISRTSQAQLDREEEKPL